MLSHEEQRDLTRRDVAFQRPEVARLFQEQLHIMARQMEILLTRNGQQDLSITQNHKRTTAINGGAGHSRPVYQMNAGGIAAAASAASSEPSADIEYLSLAQPASLIIDDKQLPGIQVLPLSEEQKEIWFVALSDDMASQAYNQSLSLRLRGPLHIRALRRALQTLVERHEALRAVFHRQYAEQRILPLLPVPLEQTNFSQLAGEEQEREVERLQRDEAQRLFDLENGPLLRTHLITLDENDHILLFTIHHLIADGRSVGTILNELSVLYAAFCTNKAHQLPVAFPYSSYVRQQREVEQSEQMQATETYWLARFADTPAPLDFPTDYQRPPIKTFHGTKHSFTLDSAMCSALKETGLRHHCTLYTILLAAYGAFLSRITGQHDLVVPISSAGQFLVEGGENLVGHCVRLLPIRLTINGNPTLSDYFHLVQQAIFEAQEHQIYPFNRLVQQLKLPRDPSRTPLIATDFNLDVAGDVPFRGLETEVQNNVTGFAQFDFSINIARSQDELLIEFSYNTDLFATETIERWESYFCTLLEHMVLESTQTFSQLTLLTSEEVQHFISGQQITEKFYPENACFLDLFGEQVERTPDAIVAACEGEQLTYRALDEHAHRMAYLLCEMGVTAEDIVVLVADRSIEFLIAMIAIFKAGGAYLPFSTQWPEKQYARILERSQARFVLTTAHHQRRVHEALHTLEGVATPRVYLLEELTRLEDEAQERALPVQNQDQLAYVIYTSGSTGVPKGAMVEHRGMLNHLCVKVNELGLTTHDVVAQNAAQSFDISVWQFLSALLVGGRVQIIPDSDVNDPRMLLEQVERFAISTLEMVPSLLQGLFLLIEAKGMQMQKLSHLRWLISTGEALPPALARQWLNAYPTIPLMNGYGPTECSDDVTHHVIDVAPAETAMLIPIGHRLANLELYVLDQDLHIQPPGTAGELYVGGIGVGRGYMHDPATTARTFVPHPFQQEPGSRLYKTGDRVRVGRDGNFEFLGRIDHQVKVRGFRIELGEIEASLYKHEGIQEVAVIVREDEPGEKRLVAYILPRAGTECTTTQVRSWLREQLPEYMVPSAFHFLERFPLTPNGKIDLRALPLPDQSGEDVPATVPGNAVESMLANIWKSVLHRTDVGMHDNFFELGGHSLLAIRVLALIRKEIEIDLSFRALFERPTIASLAELVQQMLQQKAPVASLPLARVYNATERYELSFAQKRLWVLYRMEPESPFYNIPVTLHLQGHLDHQALERAITELTQRHESLRTLFVLDDGQPRQRILPSLPAPLTVHDLRSVDASQREAQLQRQIQREVERPFTLEEGPLFRCQLLRSDEHEHVLICTMHHSIFDGWSGDIFLRELAALYTTFSRSLTLPEPPALPALPIQYKEYAHWQQSRLQGAVLDELLGYWQKQLAGAETMLHLPTDRSRPAIQTFHGAVVPFTLSATLSQQLQVLSQHEGVTLFMTLLMAFGALLSRLSQQTDLLIGSPIANRPLAELENVIGLFMNTLALRVDLTGQPTFRTLLKQVRTMVLEAYANQDLPFEKLVDALHVTRDLSHSPLFQVMFVLDTADQQETQWGDLRVGHREIEGTIAKFDVTLSVAKTPAGLAGIWEYNTDLFEETTIQRWSDQFQRLLTALVADPEQRIEQIPFLTAPERTQILETWNATSVDTVPPYTVHELFELQVERTPDTIAVLSGEQHCTYRELNRRANQLAHHLRQMGVTAEQHIGICVERSPDMLVGLLGILKAGGAYVPLDPAYPQERLAFMLEDANITLLLTQQHLCSRLPAQALQTICLDSDWRHIARRPGSTPYSSITGENLCYIIYTSGSTGTPKGVMISHRGLTNYLWWASEYYQVAAGNGSAVHSPLSFDLTVTSIFTPLLVGKRVMLLPEDQGIEGLGTMLGEAHHLGLIKLTPAHLDLLRRWLSPSQLVYAANVVVIGGEALLDKHINWWHMHIPQTRFVNEYGPTETVVGCCIYEVARDEVNQGAIPIGRPIANTQLYVLDAQMQPLPIGLTGELYIGGCGVARGYCNRPDLTAERFVPHPFSQQPGARLYKTGDLVRYRADGTLDYLGRCDSQVKLHGHRIELGEIEAVLHTHPALQEAAVLLRENTSGEKQLVAYVVPRPGHALTLGQMRQHLQAQLPNYMLPSAIVTLEQLPLSSNGKVDQRALPAPTTKQENAHNALSLPVEHELHQAHATSGAALNPIEQQLAQIWAEILELEHVGRDENFFELGGDSIVGMLMVLKARGAGLQLTSKQLFQYQTIAELAEHTHLLTARQEPEVQEQGPLPLTPIQRWFFNQNLPARQHWNQSVLLDIPEEIDVALLQTCLHTVFAAHQALHLRFVELEDGWQQNATSEARSVLLERHDLRDLLVDEQESRLTHAIQEAQSSLNLATGPLFRCVHFALGDSRPDKLLLVIHHLAVDIVSWQILLNDLQTLYRQGQRGEQLRLPPATTSYHAWAKQLEAYAQTDELQREADYWLTQDWASVKALPVDYPAGLNVEASASTVSLSLHAEETSMLLREMPRLLRVQAHEVLTTALAVALKQWTGNSVQLMDVEGHGREDILPESDLSRTVGWFTALVPICVNLRGLEGTVAQLTTVKDQLRSLPHGGIGYGLLKYLTHDARLQHQFSLHPAADIVFNYEAQSAQGLSDVFALSTANGDLYEQAPDGMRTHLLALNASVRDDQLHLDVTYSTNLHTRTTIHTFLQMYANVLRSFLAQCQTTDVQSYTPSDFPMAALEQKQLSRLLQSLDEIEEEDDYEDE